MRSKTLNNYIACLYQANIMSVIVQDVSNFGDLRGKDLYNRNLYQTVAAASAATPVSVSSNFYGLTAATGSAHTASSQFQLAQLTAVENTADNYDSSLQVTLNSGATAAVDTLVASLSVPNTQFNSTALTANFGSSYTSVLNKGVARDGVTAATVQTFNTGASGTPSSIAASGDGRLYLKSTSTQIGGMLTLIGDQINWTQSGGTAGYKSSAAGSKYIYTHNAGTAGTSTGVVQWSLDPLNVDGNQMGTGAFNFLSYNSSGATEQVLSVGGGAAAGVQPVAFTNSIIGLGQQPVAGQTLSVTGASTFTGSSTVTGDLSVVSYLVCRNPN